eukprot:jgi/Tetstr1/426187/TSEL_016512.t1
MTPTAAAAAAVGAGEEEKEEREHEGGHVPDAQEGGDPAGDAGSGKKKKKKKKKKNKGGGGGEDSGPSSGEGGDGCKLSGEEKAEADKRFSKCLAEVKSNEEDCMWVNLQHCGLTDAKVNKLLTALQNNTSVTMMDLSDNGLTDVGIQALATSLIVGNAAPELITLDVSGNKMTEAGLTALSGLQKIRKTLTVTSAKAEAPDPEAAGPDAGAKSSPPKQGSLVNSYFQVGNDEGGGDKEEPEEGTAEGEEGAAPAPATVWAHVESVLSAEPVVPGELAAALSGVADGVAEEMNNCALPLLPGTGREELRPHTQAALDHLGLLGRALAVPGGARISQHSPTQPQPTVGIHRVAVASVVAQLMRGGAACIDSCIEAEELLLKILELALQFPTCSPLQATSLRILRAALGSPATGLWLPLVEKSRGDCEDPIPLQSSLAKLGSQAVDLPVGKRSGIAGFVLSAARTLHDVSRAAPPRGLPLFECRVTDSSGSGLVEGGPGADAPAAQLVMEPAAQEELRRWLEEDAEWTEFAKPGGALETLLAQQEQELGGPRPARAPLQPQSSDLANLMSSGMSSTDMLRLLKGMSFGMSSQ